MLLQSPVNKTIVTTVGYTFKFEKNEPLEVPSVAVQHCLNVGCHLVEGEVLTPEEKKAAIVVQGEEREETIKEALDAIVARNLPAEFTGAGKPGVDVIRAEVGFAVDSNERDKAWAAYAAATEAE